MSKRKHVLPVVIAVLAVLLLAAGTYGMLLWRSAQHVIDESRQAGEYASLAQTAIKRGDVKQALAQLDKAGDHIVAARDETRSPLWSIAERAPYYGSDVAAVRGMLDAAADAATNALPSIDDAAQGTLVDFNLSELLSGASLSDGTMSIPKITSVKQDLADAGAVLDRVQSSIHALPQPHTTQVADMVEQGKRIIDQVNESFDTISSIIEKIPG
ncbi:moaA protein [Bifidobacterium amazonense]|uniref:MoaA protein n=1 Tax=Bifidobacterium amazonense TaxID=2809027 RepID=A0ABS9VSG8_9BIFI|nr:moaA protein [Bifidobacterium amazonense]MCH9275037.1 moaA protein [Bifidobacterium amazonense]